MPIICLNSIYSLQAYGEAQADRKAAGARAKKKMEGFEVCARFGKFDFSRIFNQYILDIKGL
jgi:hypothetical protein